MKMLLCDKEWTAFAHIINSFDNTRVHAWHGKSGAAKMPIWIPCKTIVGVAHTMCLVSSSTIILGPEYMHTAHTNTFDSHVSTNYANVSNWNSER